MATIPTKSTMKIQNHDMQKKTDIVKRTIYGSILSENQNKPIIKTFNKHYICKLCGEYCECILKIHAEKHGYKTKKEFLDSGNLVAV